MSNTHNRDFIFSKKMLSEELKEFELTFPDILKYIENCKFYSDYQPQYIDRILRAIKYNVPDGKKTRGLCTVLAYKCFSSLDDNMDGSSLGTSFSSDAPASNVSGIRDAQILGWCIEFLQASFLLADDIMDKSEYRRGKICWYKVPEVSLNAINDALLLENLVYQILTEHFAENSVQRLGFNDLFRDVTIKTICGQIMDLEIPLQKTFKNYTIESYSTIVKLKTNYYTFYLPIMLAVLLSGRSTSDNLIDQIKEVLFRLGFLFQVQDDFLDCFGNETITGKIGTDIEEKKCSWLIVKALEKANEDQRKKLESNYGIKEPVAIQSVKSIFNELELENEFKEFEKKEFEAISNMINNIAKEKVREFLHSLLHLILKREK